MRTGSVRHSTELAKGKYVATTLTGVPENTAAGVVSAGQTSKKTEFQPFCNWICCVRVAPGDAPLLLPGRQVITAQHNAAKSLWCGSIRREKDTAPQEIEKQD